MRRWVRAFLAQVWKACVMAGRLSAGERLADTDTDTGPGKRSERSERPARPESPARSGPPRPADPSGPPATLPGHPERVPPADETTPESLAFWAQVHRLRDEALPRGPRDGRGQRK